MASPPRDTTRLLVIQRQEYTFSGIHSMLRRLAQRLSRAAPPLMKRGTLLNTSSMSANCPILGRAKYEPAMLSAGTCVNRKTSSSTTSFTAMLLVARIVDAPASQAQRIGPHRHHALCLSITVKRPGELRGCVQAKTSPLPQHSNRI